MAPTYGNYVGGTWTEGDTEETVEVINPADASEVVSTYPALTAADAVWAYGDRLSNVHLKDIREPGRHRCVGLGEGVVDIDGTPDALVDIGYEGPVTVEHEPYDRDPMPEVRTSIERVRAWQTDR